MCESATNPKSADLKCQKLTPRGQHIVQTQQMHCSRVANSS